MKLNNTLLSTFGYTNALRRDQWARNHCINLLVMYATTFQLSAEICPLWFSITVHSDTGY